jgi:isoleucyl-tRNA synthetase
VQEGQRKFLSTLWNTYAFFVLYANIDNFDATKYNLEYDKLAVMDQWILSRLNSTIKAVDENLAGYKIPEAARALDAFVDELSNWYVRRCRSRFWAKGMEQDKINAYETLYHCLVEISKAAAPMVPFMTEEIYQNLVRSIDQSAPESIHLCDFPEVHTEWINAELEDKMDELLKVVVLGRACRNESGIKNRQPIGQMYIKAERELPEFYLEIIQDELNVKKATFTKELSSLTTYTFKPQLRTVGPKYGKFLKGIQNALAELNGNEAMEQLKTEGVLKLPEVDTSIELSMEDLLIAETAQEGFVTDQDGDITVVLDTNLTEELLEEGMVREIISKIQTMRKEADFEVMDHIAVAYTGSDKVAATISKNKEMIAGEVLAVSLEEGNAAGNLQKEWNINGEKVTLSVEKR